MDLSNVRIFTLLRQIENDEAATKAMAAINALSIDTVEALANHSRHDFVQKGLEESVIDEMQGILQTSYETDFRRSLDEPVESLLSELEGDLQSETTRYVQFKDIKTVRDLAAKPREYLLEQGMSEATVSGLAQILESVYESPLPKQPEPDESAVKEVMREYSVETTEEGLVVNGNLVKLKKGPKAFTLDELSQIFTRHSAGEEVPQIAEAVGRGPLSVTQYLREAGVIPPAQKRTGSYRRAGGAPPVSPMQTYLSTL